MLSDSNVISDSSGVGIDEKTIAELVVEDYRRADVFKRYGIDFCCGGGRPLAAVCEKRGLDIDAVKADLVAAGSTPDAPVHPERWAPEFLVDYVVSEHHSYVNESLPVMREYLDKVARVHGHANPEVVEIAGLFGEVATEMSQHMMKEERVLFPYIKELAAAGRDHRTVNPAGFGSVRNPIGMMEHEHEHAGSLMRQIRELSSDFVPPEHACNTYRVAFAKLEEFEADLHRHVHLENNILFPKAIALEREASPAA